MATENVFDIIADGIAEFKEWIWYIAFIFLVFAAIYFCYKFRLVQLKKIPEQVKLITDTARKETHSDKISSFQAFCVSMGARIGIGNIAGVGTAIIFGGPGAIFWMWIFAILSSATSFVESIIGQIFKENKSDGGFHGGPAYYIKNGLKNKRFALVIAFWIIITYGISFTCVQAANSCTTFSQLDIFSNFNNTGLVVGIVFAILTAYLVFGGLKRIAKASVYIVPIMALLWVITTVIAIAINYQNIGLAFQLIVTNAFNLTSGLGGLIGTAVIWGLKRGVFSNEAGIGSVPNVSSEADVEHPVVQGHIQSLSVLFVTLIFCSLSAFTILTFYGGTDFGGITDGTRLIEHVLLNTFHGYWSYYVLTFVMFMFAFSSLIAYYSMAESNLRFIKDDERCVFILRIIIIVSVFIACLIPIGTVWNITDICMAGMGIMNVYAILKLSKYAIVAYKDYNRQKAAGVNEPVFEKKVLEDAGLDASGVKMWPPGE